jgi:8-oxo-dGTP pyrophosphatase MutT (NUDIX family)
MMQFVIDAVQAVDPFDETEQQHKGDVVAWIASGDGIYRDQNPAKHLVSYFVLFDKKRGKLMLIDHVKAKLWLPTGGHVELDEDPRTTVLREAYEELQLHPTFEPNVGSVPLFLTVTLTKGANPHTDVSLWYVVSGDSETTLDYDHREMNGYKWLTPDEILATEITELDPHMHRFVRKMQHKLKETR